MEVLDLFSGCGGMSLGLEMAGFKHARLIENDRRCVESLAANRPDWPVDRVDARDVDFTEWEGVDLVAGGPPCQPFSAANLHRSGESDDRDMFPVAIDAVRKARPKMFLFETVPGIAERHWEYFENRVLGELVDLGYKVQWATMNAARYGVPQKRKRIFVVGSKFDFYLFPFAYLQDAAAVTIKDALEGLPEPDGSVPLHTPVLEGTLPRDHPRFEAKWRAMNRIYDPAKTIMARRAWWHNSIRIDRENYRFLTDRECMRLQTFPDDWIVVGGERSRMRQIGNAVPVRLAHLLGKSIRKHLEYYEGKENA